MTPHSSQRNSFKTAWITHLTGKEAEDFKILVLNSTQVLGRLKQILLEEIRSLEAKDELSLDAYDNPGWAYKQAHLNGRKAALKKIDQLL